VLATDIAASMVDLAAAAASRAGLTNVATRVMDAQRLEVEAESFDAVISVWPHADPRLPQGVDGDPTSVAKRWEGRRNGVLDPGQYPFLSIPHSIARRVEVWRYHRSLSGNSG
jgi:Methyltransferase domain